jgi:hypothetical protein
MSGLRAVRDVKNEPDNNIRQITHGNNYTQKQNVNMQKALDALEKSRNTSRNTLPHGYKPVFSTGGKTKNKKQKTKNKEEQENINSHHHDSFTK